MKKAGFVAAAVLAVLAWSGTSAVAQVTASATVTIDFAFTASGKEMPAGEYLVRTEPGRVTVSPMGASKEAVIMPVLTRLGRHDDDSFPELVFDKLGGKFLLSEVWVPGADGFMLLATAVEHDHAIQGGVRSHR
jgi:hypothetical protein